MFEQQGGMMLVRADLCDRLAQLQAMAGRMRPGDMARSVDAIRLTAAAYGLMPVARLAEALERALAEPDAPGCPAALYLDRLRDAIGCDRLDEDAAQALIASVSVRLAG